MRILHTIESMNPAFGGTVECVAQLATALAGMHAVDNEILSLDAPEAPLRATPGVVVHTLGPPRTFYRYCHELSPWLRSHLGRFDSVLIHGLWRHHASATAKQCQRMRLPYDVVVHSMLNPWFETQGRFKHLRKSLYWKAIEHSTLSRARSVVFTSDEERRQAAGSFSPYRFAEAVLPLGTSDPPKQDRELLFEAYPMLRGKRILLFLGRLHPMKACDALIAAFAKAMRDDPSFRLVMAGPDSVGWRAELERLAQSKGIAESIVWTGPLYDSLKWSAFRAAELFLLPSHCEAFPYAVLEALGSSVPVLVSDKVNIHSYLREPECALVTDDTESGIAKALSTWALMRSPRRSAMADNARQCFLRTFHIERTARLWHSYLVGSTS